MRMLITGGAGFIGSHLADLLLAHGHDVRVLDNLDPQVHAARTRPAYLAEAAELVTGDVRSRDDVRQALDGVDAVFHLAAAVGVGQSQYEIERYTDVNVRGTATLLDVLANEKHGVRKVVVASSMSIYGEGLYVDLQTGARVNAGMRGVDQLARGEFEIRDAAGRPLVPVPTPESKPADCQSIYALNKRDQEEYVLLFGRTYGIPTVAARLFNTYGSRQSLRNPYTGAAAIFISRARRGLPPLIYEDGAQQRDFVEVRDVARALLLLHDAAGADGGVFNVGSGHPVTIHDVARRICEVAGGGIEPEITGRTRKGDIRHCFADIGAIRALGFEPSIGIDEGLADLYAATAADDASADDAAVNAELERRRLLV